MTICNNSEYVLQCTNSLEYKYKFFDISFNITLKKKKEKKNLWQSSDNLTSDWTNSDAQETDTWGK